MELRHLRYFVAVAEALSFRKAARRLSVSAAAVSQQMHARAYAKAVETQRRLWLGALRRKVKIEVRLAGPQAP